MSDMQMLHGTPDAIHLAQEVGRLLIGNRKSLNPMEEIALAVGRSRFRKPIE